MTLKYKPSESTVGKAQKNNGHPYISVASDELTSLPIHRDKS